MPFYPTHWLCDVLCLYIRDVTILLNLSSLFENSTFPRNPLSTWILNLWVMGRLEQKGHISCILNTIWINQSSIITWEQQHLLFCRWVQQSAGCALQTVTFMQLAAAAASCFHRLNGRQTPETNGQVLSLLVLLFSCTMRLHVEKYF